ncbi:MAG: DegV family protein [Firmicutes bacterium]|nr:DegV family protein [Bacillota bacterium]
MQIKITADSTCDLQPSFLQSMDITLVPLHILVGDDSYRDGVDISPQEIFRHVEAGKTCKTAAVNVWEYEQIFAQYAQKYEAVIHLSLGSKFSSSYQNALSAAKNFSNVFVIDTQNLSSGSGHLVYEAALLAQEGLPAEEIVAKVTAMIPLVNASFIIDRLDYLHKGGRCSGLEAFGASLLQIKPCIEVINGKMTVGKKYRGKLEHCLLRYVKDRLEGREDIDYSRIFITHAACPAEIVEKVREAIRTYAPFIEIIESFAGCTVSTHCGPKTLGILYKQKPGFPKSLA